MNELLKLGVTEDEIKVMMEVNSDIINLRDEEVEQLRNLLLLNNCDEVVVREIIVVNPYYLSRNYDDVKMLILKLKELGITRLDVTFQSNPWMLNYDSFEIDEFIKMKQKEGLTLEEIIDLIDRGVVE